MGCRCSGRLPGLAERSRRRALLACAARWHAVEFAQFGQLELRGLVRWIQLQGLVIGVAGEPGVNIAEVLVGDRVARMSPDGHLEYRQSHVVLLLLGVENGKVVVGFGLLGKFFGQIPEDANRFRRAAHFNKDQPLEESSLQFFRLLGNLRVDLLQRLQCLPLLQ